MNSDISNKDKTFIDVVKSIDKKKRSRLNKNIAINIARQKPSDKRKFSTSSRVYTNTFLKRDRLHM